MSKLYKIKLENKFVFEDIFYNILQWFFLIKMDKYTQPIPSERDNNAITISVLWHSTVLINLYWYWIITDPVLFDKVGLQIWRWKIGMKRIKPLAIDLDNIPKIDLILLSHTHMDHLDIQSIKRLSGKNFGDIKIICSHNTSKILKNIKGISQIHELDRDKSIEIDDINIKSFETKHRWARRPWQKGKHTRWSDKSHSYNAYMINSRSKSIFFGGDTAYTDIYKNTVDPTDVAIMPIWAYHPWIHSHCDPHQALDMALDLKAKYFIPIHCETFRLGHEHINEPREIISHIIKDHEDIKVGSKYIWDILVLK